MLGPNEPLPQPTFRSVHFRFIPFHSTSLHTLPAPFARSIVNHYHHNSHREPKSDEWEWSERSERNEQEGANGELWWVVIRGDMASRAPRISPLGPAVDNECWA